MTTSSECGIGTTSVADEPPIISAEGERAVAFVFDACRYFGASLVTAHKVCALMAEHVERIEAERG